MKRSAGLLSTEDNKRMRDGCAGWPEGRNSPPQGGIKHQSLHLLHLRATEKAREQGEHKEEEKEQACRDHGILINNSLKTI